MTGLEQYLEAHPEVDEAEVTPEMVDEYFRDLADDAAEERAEDRILFREDY